MKIKNGGYDRLFHKIYVSADLCLKKPDKDIYEYVLKDLNLAPEEAVFIDNMERNTVVAEELGIKSIVFKDAGQLKEDLRKFGIKV